MKKSISRSSSCRSIATFSFVTYLDTIERARVYYSKSNDCYYLCYSFLKTRYLRMPLGHPSYFRDDLGVIKSAVNYISKNFQHLYHV